MTTNENIFAVENPEQPITLFTDVKKSIKSLYTSGKPIVILDLDQTLISAEESDEFMKSANRLKADKYKSFEMEENGESFFHVFERPGLQEFLDYLFREFTVCVWTAASKDYALFIIEKFILASKPERVLDFIFFSYHCDLSSKCSKTKRTKDLSMLEEFYNIEGYKKGRMMIIDDYDDVYKSQPGECIAIYPFEFNNDGSENDKVLVDMIPKLKKAKEYILNSEGIRPADIVNEG